MGPSEKRGEDVRVDRVCTKRRTAKAEENNVKTSELQTILGYLNIGLAVAHNIGVSVGHFGSTDFVELAQSVNSLLLEALAPQISSTAAVSSAPVAVSVATAN